MSDHLQYPALAVASKTVDCLKIEPVTVRFPKAMWSSAKINLAKQM